MNTPTFWSKLAASLAKDRPFDTKAATYTALFLTLAYALLLLVPTLASWSEKIASGRQPEFGTDFLSFYAASALALAGQPADVYNQALHMAAQRSVFHANTGYYAFYYPPMFLLLCAPLALLPYYAALAAWLGATFAACFAALRQWAPTMGAGGSLLPTVAFPASMMNVFHGQNAFLTTALLATGLLALERRPVLAGALFGALIFKPQFGLLIPVLLLITGNWRAIFAAGASALAFMLASLALLGAEVWRGYFAIAPLAQKALDENHVGDEKMQSVFAMMRIVGASVNAAYIAQALAGLIVCGVLIYASRRTKCIRSLGALMVTGVLLTTPFMLRYDLMLLAIPLLWLASEAARTGFLRGEKAVAGAAYLLPLVPIAVAMVTYVLLAPLIIGALFIMQARRILATPNL
jgi:hypothetical protein